jgi:phosphohistidine swiveling domain-containing protein
MTTSRVCEWDAEPNPVFNFWTIGNASEIVPGVVKPLTATLFQPMDHVSTRLCSEWIGVLDLVPSFPPPTGNFASTYAGRFALNLAWANAIIATWQVEGTSGLMDQYITSTEGADIKSGVAADRERALGVWRRVRRIWGRLPRQVGAERRRIDAVRAVEGARDLSRLSERQLWRLVLRLRNKLDAPFARHLYVSGAAGDHTDRLGKLLDRALPGHDPALVIALTSALRNVESAAPAKGAWDLARWAAGRPGLAAQLRGLGAGAIAERLASPPDADWRAFAAEFQRFIAEYGFRGQGEVDPSYADWSEEPAFAIGAVKTALEAPPEKDPHVLEERSARAREAVEAQIGPAIPRGMRREYRELIAGAQRFTRLRESTKANWVRLCRPLRPPLLELGRRLAARGLIAEQDDIFWLLASEVEAAVRGGLKAERVREAVERRKADAARLAETELPEVFELPVTPMPGKAAEREGDVLKGMPVSAGQARGPARIVLSAEAAVATELRPGEVLVAPYTDAPWTPLFVPAAAVVVETGGILSHAATVAREYGIPAVVAVKGATRLIREGQVVTVDGMAGTVTLG